MIHFQVLHPFFSFIRTFFKRNVWAESHLIRNPALARYSVLVWHKHGLLTIASSEQDICLDICICMDVESNPGPDNRFECESHTTRLITYTKQDLLRLRKFPASRLKPMPAVVQKLKMFNLYRYRGCRGGSW